MARAKTRDSQTGTRSRAATSRRNRVAGSRQDAIALLKADHRQVKEWFAEFEKARSSQRKLELAGNICKALKVHTTIEEEIFYPAFLEATGDKDTHHEAQIEHAGAKAVVADIEASAPDDDYYDSRVKVLSEMIKHHVNEEEQPGGMFAEARKSGMDLRALGEELQERKRQLMSEAPVPRSRREARPSVAG